MTFLPFLLRSEEHTSELQSHLNLVCRLLLEKNKACCMAASVRVSTVMCVCRLHSACVCDECHARCVGAVLWVCVVRVRYLCLVFFFNMRAPPRSSPFPPRAAFRF